MSSENMICPKCKKFQPAADTCAECGVVVAKLRNPPNTRTAPTAKKEARQPSLPSGESHFAYFRPFIIATVVITIGSVATWFFRGSNFGLDRYSNAAQGMQQAAERNRQLTEELTREMEAGSRYRTRSVTAKELGLDLHRFAAELNAVASTKTVSLQARDLQSAVTSCAEFTNGYFTVLRYGDSESYPLPNPDTIAYEKGSPKGRYRCDGSDGIVYLNEAPTTNEEHSACWSREDPRIPVAGSSRRTKRVRTWVRMKWDTEASHWSVYSRADQRHVDRKRLEKARVEVNGDIDREHESRAPRAQKKMPKLIGQIEEAREKLKVISNEDTRKELERSLKRHERNLRSVLVDQRYTQICKVAATAALDAREEML